MIEEDKFSLQPPSMCNRVASLIKGTWQSQLSHVDLAKLCEKCDEKEGEVENEEKDPVGSGHMETA